MLTFVRVDGRSVRDQWGMFHGALTSGNQTSVQ